MNKAQRKARIKALKKNQKERRKRATEENAPQPEQTQAKEQVMQPSNETSTEIFSAEEIRNALRGAMQTVQRVMNMVNKAIDAVDEADADAVHATRVTAQRKRDDFIGVRSDESTIIRAHPLFALWKLADQCARQIERLVVLTSPDQLARQRAKAAKAKRDAEKLEKKAEKAVA